MKCLKTIRSYTGFARWLAETTDDPHAWLPRSAVAAIPSPYAYSPTKGIYRWGDKEVVSFETSHRKFQVFEVPAEMTRYATDEEATEVYIASTRKES